MAAEVKLPRLGQGMESGTIVKWLKAEGDAVEKGEPLYELDTEKVTQEVEAEAAGVRASAGSSSRRSRAPARRGASSPRTSTAPPPVRRPHPRQYLSSRARSSRSR